MRSLLWAFAMSILIAPLAFSQDESLVLYLPFDEGEGDIAHDMSGKGNDGTIHGAKWVDGKKGKALEFNGRDSYVEIPHSDTLSPQKEITVMAWVFVREGASGELMIVSKGEWAPNLPYELSIVPEEVIFWQFYDNAGRDQCAPPAPPSGEWHHIAGTYDGERFKCYVDGELKKEFPYQGKLPQNTANVTIGRRSTADECYFDGIIDEVAIFERALSEDEIREAMEGIKAAVDAGGKLPIVWGKVKSY